MSCRNFSSSAKEHASEHQRERQDTSSALDGIKQIGAHDFVAHNVSFRMRLLEWLMCLMQKFCFECVADEG